MKFSKLFSKRTSKRLPVNKVVNFCKRKMRKAKTVLTFRGFNLVNISPKKQLFTYPPYGGSKQ